MKSLTRYAAVLLIGVAFLVASPPVEAESGYYWLVNPLPSSVEGDPTYSQREQWVELNDVDGFNPLGGTALIDRDPVLNNYDPNEEYVIYTEVDHINSRILIQPRANPRYHGAGTPIEPTLEHQVDSDLPDLPSGPEYPETETPSLDQIRLNFLTPQGIASNATVRIYAIVPGVAVQGVNQPPRLIGGGTTDSNGNFSMDVGVAADQYLAFDDGIDSFHPNWKKEHQAATDEILYSAVVLAVDQSKQYWGHWGIVLSTTKGLNESINLGVSLPQEQRSWSAEDLTSYTIRTCVPALDPDGGDPLDPIVDEAAPEPEDVSIGESSSVDAGCLPAGVTASSRNNESLGGIVVKTVERWVLIATQSNQPGFRSEFTMADARETRTQIGFQASGEDWEVGGWRTEAQERGFSRTKVRTRDFHTNWYARYVWHKYYNCSGGEVHYCWYTWEPYTWTGEMGTNNQALPDWESKYSIKVEATEIVRKNSVDNYEYGTGVSIAGLSLNSKTGYSTTTRIVWHGVPAGNNCIRRLWSGTTIVKDAPRLWTYNTNCHY